MPENFLEINRYFALALYCNTIGQSNNAFSILGFSLAGKRRVHVLIFDKTNNEHLPKPFFKVIRKSLYQTVLNARPFGRITSNFTCYTVTHLSHFSLLTSLFLEASSNGRILTAILPSSASSKAYDNSTGTVSLENKQTKDI